MWTVVKGQRDLTARFVSPEQNIGESDLQFAVKILQQGNSHGNLAKYNSKQKATGKTLWLFALKDRTPLSFFCVRFEGSRKILEVLGQVRDVLSEYRQ